MNADRGHLQVENNGDGSDDDFSDEEMWANMDFGAFDLINLTDCDREIIANHNADVDADDNSDWEDDIPLFYHAPEFTWTHRPYNVNCRAVFDIKSPDP